MGLPWQGALGMATAPPYSNDFLLLTRRAKVHLGRVHPAPRKRRCGQDTPMHQAWRGAQGPGHSIGWGASKDAGKGPCKVAWKTKGVATGLYSRETTPGIGVTHMPMVHVEVETEAEAEASPGPIPEFGFGDYHGPGPGPGPETGTEPERFSRAGLVLTVSSVKGGKEPTRALVVGVQRREVQELWDMSLGILQEPCASFGAGKLFLSASIARVV